MVSFESFFLSRLMDFSSTFVVTPPTLNHSGKHSLMLNTHLFNCRLLI